ncbi:MAG: hypothetical protein WCT40_00355 [Candidatus Magasanikbacteria bacterium]|jgi:hypothetical protein
MRNQLTVYILALGVLAFLGAGCASQGVSLYVDDTKQNDAGGVVTVSTNSGWSHYENKKYGISFDYPSNWTRQDSTSDDFLSVRLGNADCASAQCPPDFVGVEIRAGVIKNKFTDLSAWVDSQIALNNKTGILPGGKIESVSIGGRGAIKVAKSDWRGALPGAAYYLDQDQYHYTYIATGKNDTTAGALTTVEKVIASVRIFANQLPAIIVDEGDESTSTVPPEIRNGKLYSNERYAFTFRYPEECVFVNNSDQVYPPVQVELFACGKDEKDKTISLRVVSSTVEAEVKKAFGGRKLKYYQNIVLVSDRKGIIVSFAKGARNKAERYVIVGRGNYVYVLSVKDDTKTYATNFDKLLSGLSIAD